MSFIVPGLNKTFFPCETQFFSVLLARCTPGDTKETPGLTCVAVQDCFSTLQPL